MRASKVISYRKRLGKKPNLKTKLLRQPPDLFLTGCSSAGPVSASIRHEQNYKRQLFK